jgi:hypothetical protein
MQVKKAKTKVLKDCVSNAVKKVTMLIIVQQSVRGFCLVTMDYIASSVEKMDILLVGVQKRMVINARIEVSIPLLLVKHNRQHTKARKACFYCNKEGHFISQYPRSLWIKWRRILKVVYEDPKYDSRWLSLGKETIMESI